MFDPHGPYIIPKRNPCKMTVAEAIKNDEFYVINGELKHYKGILAINNGKGIRLGKSAPYTVEELLSQEVEKTWTVVGHTNYTCVKIAGYNNKEYGEEGN